MQSSARQRVKWLKFKCKPTLIERSIPRREQQHCPSLRSGRFEVVVQGLSLAAPERAEGDSGTGLLPCSWKDAELTKRFLKATSI